MRAILNISLPQVMAEDVKDYVAEGKYSTISEFFRDLVRNWQEDRLLKELKESEAEFRAGKFKVLKSLKDLR
jgi:Arc/MetJ-type ribon-helix-helix transcriptional regulator